MAVCNQCGAPLEPNATKCKYCGEPTNAATAAPQPVQVVQQQAPAAPQQPIYIAAAPNANDGIDPSWPIKSKVTAGVLALLLGGLGIHKFYLGKMGQGVLYLLFCWTYVPAIIGFVEGIMYLTANDHNFQVKNRVRIQ